MHCLLPTHTQNVQVIIYFLCFSHANLNLQVSALSTFILELDSKTGLRRKGPSLILEVSVYFVFCFPFLDFHFKHDARIITYRINHLPRKPQWPSYDEPLWVYQSPVPKCSWYKFSYRNNIKWKSVMPLVFKINKLLT